MTPTYDLKAIFIITYRNTTVTAFRELVSDAQLQMLAEVKDLLTSPAIKPRQKNQLAAQLSLLSLDEELDQPIRSAALSVLENWENPL